MALIDRIKYDGPEDGSSWLVYKFPSEKFVLGSQLIVNQGQEALFFKGGKALDSFGPGTHTLKTGNLPLLHHLVNLPFGGRTPFSAEVYFVNTTASLTLRWGTSSPIPLEDPVYHMILSIRARGQYGISIEDSKLFVSRMIGAQQGGHTLNNDLVLDSFNGLINAKIKSITSQWMRIKGISFVDINAYLDEISSEYKEAVWEEFSRYGIEILSFYVESISPPKEDFEHLRREKEELALGKDFYQQRRSLDIMEKFVENPGSGNMAGAFMGLGAGMGAAPAMGEAFQQISQGLASGEQSQPATEQPATEPATPQTTQVGGRFCTSCGQPLPAGNKFCGHCGTAQQQERRCSGCGELVPEAMKFCGQCGTQYE